ncbi:MAG: response regulator [Gemmatimonadota bacterium]|nr:response regulator [Gemmatimonadota bacterium]
MKILIIEDDSSIAKCMNEFFKIAGHDCDIYLNPEEGLSACKNGEYDVVFSDIRMPGMDGIQVIGKIREHDPEACVILMTGYADVENAIEAVNNGAYAFFRKPLDIKIIIKTLEKIEKDIGSKLTEQTKDSELMRLCLEYRDLEASIRTKISEHYEYV